MRKIILAFAFFILFFGFGSKSLAFEQTDIETAFIDALNTNYNTNVTVSTQNFNNVRDFLTLWNLEQYHRKKLIMYIGDTTRINFALVDSYDITGDSISYSYLRRMSYFYSGTFAGRFSTLGSTGSTSNDPYDNFIDFGDLETFMNPTNFDDIYYNPIIPTPNFSIKNFIHLNDYSIDYTMLVSDQAMSIDDHPLYLMSMIYFYVPENVYINYDSYSPSNYRKGGPFYIADYEDLELVNYQSYDLDNRFHSDYQSYYESIANNRNVSSPSSMSAGTLLQRTNQFVSDAAKGIPYMGNGLEVWARYFYIDDGIVYAGDWKKWNSYRYREYERVVAEEEDTPSKGISQTVTENDPNTQGDTYDPIGVQTGNASYTVNVNTSVPNYPDYPTIASFNKDNALVQVIDAASYMADPNNGFFGQFGGFLSAIFGFIPDSVWFIIGTGFSVSIFVMFLKIL